MADNLSDNLSLFNYLLESFDANTLPESARPLYHSINKKLFRLCLQENILNNRNTTKEIDEESLQSFKDVFVNYCRLKEEVQKDIRKLNIEVEREIYKKSPLKERFKFYIKNLIHNILSN